VQGVGFRPFVYRLARRLGLTGWVGNDARGVTIEVQGDAAALDELLERVQSDKPAAARIERLDVESRDPETETEFSIRASDIGEAPTTQVLPELATCSDCLRELFDPHDRRSRYPFLNCTNCGPRFSIIRALPYDRSRTTMERFEMCGRCLAEYEDPEDRRFHAQPNACPECGPRLAYHDSEGKTLAGDDEALQLALRTLDDAGVVAVKGLGGFQLMVDAGSGRAVERLRRRKLRRDKPLALMVSDLDQARTLCRVEPEAETVLSSAEAPIVLLERLPTAAVDGGVAPGNPYLGLMLPTTPLHHLLLAGFGRPLVATSGNVSDEPICIDEQEALTRLAGLADGFLVHDRPIARHVDDSVIRIVEGQPRLMRRARGYAPRPVLQHRELPTVLAVGAHLKNSIALSVGARVFLSQHIGDMETPEAVDAFERVIADFLALYDARPVAVAHDLHPDYASTQWAREQVAGRGRPQLDRLRGLPTIAVQHHHAHLVACLAEHGLDVPALGVSWDGTGYGTDDTIWGGEFLLGDASGYDRVAHLTPFSLPGGDAAVREPRRTGLALLFGLAGESAFERVALAPVRDLTEAERSLFARMLAGGTNCPRTTSAGRLFDGVSALLGLRQRATFEGQAAMALEFVADRDEHDAYPIELEDGVLDWRPLVAAVVEDHERKVGVASIAARFHNALAVGIEKVALRVGCPRVALSGGCFQNRLLLERTVQRLRASGFEPLLHREVPPNDGGIALGQIHVATAQL